MEKGLYAIDIDLEQHKIINDNLKGINVHISAIAYSNLYTNRVGEIALPLTALYYENSIDQMIVIDDTGNIKSAELWSKRYYLIPGYLQNN